MSQSAELVKQRANPLGVALWLIHRHLAGNAHDARGLPVVQVFEGFPCPAWTKKGARSQCHRQARDVEEDRRNPLCRLRCFDVGSGGMTLASSVSVHESIPALRVLNTCRFPRLADGTRDNVGVVVVHAPVARVTALGALQERWRTGKNTRIMLSKIMQRRRNSHERPNGIAPQVMRKIKPAGIASRQG